VNDSFSRTVHSTGPVNERVFGGPFDIVLDAQTKSLR
jgi:hypothetical protein